MVTKRTCIAGCADARLTGLIWPRDKMPCLLMVTLVVATIVCFSPLAQGEDAYISGVPDYQNRDFVGDNDCAPTAAACVLGYWDSNGYPDLISGSADYSSNQAGVTEVVNFLKADMGWPSPSTPPFPEGTPIEIIDDGIIGTANTRRGYSFSSGLYSPASWDSLKTEIKSGRPFVFSVNHPYYDNDPDKVIWHSVAGVGFRESGGTGGTTLNLGASADAYIESDHPNANHGSETSIVTGRWSDGNEYKSVIKFDLGSIPSGELIQSATLRLHCSILSNLNHVDIAMLDGTWTENAITYATCPGRYVGGPFAGFVPVSGYCEADVTEFVKRWFTEERPNNGFHLEGTGSGSGQWAFFDSREGAFEPWQPTLIIQTGTWSDKVAIVHDNWATIDYQGRGISIPPYDPDVWLNFNECGDTYLTWVTPGAGSLPSKAANPDPPQNASGVSISTDLSWSNGGGATSYDVYFGTNSTPDSGESKGNQAGTSYDPGTLSYNTDYYWRIDAKNSSGTTTGDVWHFTTISESVRSVDIAAVNMIPNPADSGESVSITGSSGTFQAGTRGEIDWVVLGFRDSGGHWVGGEPQVVFTQAPGDTLSHPWTGSETSITAPAEPGTYYLWALNSPANNAAGAIDDFKTRVPTTVSPPHDRWDTPLQVEQLHSVSIPVFSPAAPYSFATSVDVTITCATAGATIRYTTNGVDPTASSMLYSGSVHLTTTTTLKARAFKSGMTDSAVASGVYTKMDQVATPVFNPSPGTYPMPVDVTITCATAGATIRYTTDGSMPTSSHGTVIASGASVRLTSTTTLKAIGYKSGMTDSAVVASGVYTKIPQVATPVFSPAPGTYAMPMDVTITCATAGATIKCTTDGSTPTPSHGTVIASGASVHLTSTTTLKAIGYKSGMTDSAVASGVYTKMEQVSTPTFTPDAPYSFATSVDVTVACATGGATIRYTTNGSDPTSSSTLYTGPVHLTTTTTLKARAFKSGMTDSAVQTGLYVKDSAPPLTSGAAALPSVIREGIDLSLELTATGDDSATGGSKIEEAEYFIGADPGVGNGTPMNAADRAFDEPTEGLEATVNTSSWTKGTYRINVRAKDAAGLWTRPVDHVDVPCVDGTPPSSAPIAGEAGPGLDKIAGQAWNTLGTLLPEEEEKVIDLGAVKNVGGVGLSVELPTTCFPTDFSMEASKDGSDWTLLGKAVSFRPARGDYLWQCNPSEYRYVKIKALSRRDRSDGHYYVRVPEVSVYESPGGNSVVATWRATADDDNDGSSGNADVYDLRWSEAPITAANFGSATPVPTPPTPSPGIKGTLETCTFSVGSATRVWVALKVGDEVPNWSGLTTAGPIDIVPIGFTSIAPGDLATLGPSDAAVTFQFQRDPTARPCYISFSGGAGFPQRPTVGGDGELCRTMRFPLRAGIDTWTPSTAQWTAIRKLVHTSGLLYWRIEGRIPAYGNVYGANRTIIFDCGDINNLHVAPSHLKGGEEAVWPDKDIRPTFSWNDDTTGMAYFLIDISKDETIPLTDRRSTITLGGRGIAGTAYMLKTAEWKRVRRLATWLKTPAKTDTADGTLYWRVRALTSDRALSCASAVKMLIIDRGDWDLDPPVDNGDGTWTFSWTHTGDGIAKYALEFSMNNEFNPRARETVKVPARSLTEESYTLKPAEVRRLRTLAARNGVAALHWRVRGEDGDRQFVCYSDEYPTPWPVP